MPEREDVASCVDVAVMYRIAVAASPSSHSKTGSTFRTARRNELAARTRLGCVGFVDQRGDELAQHVLALVGAPQ